MGLALTLQLHIYMYRFLSNEGGIIHGLAETRTSGNICTHLYIFQVKS